MAGRITTQLVIEGINKAKKAFTDVQKDLSNTESAASKAGSACNVWRRCTSVTRRAWAARAMAVATALSSPPKTTTLWPAKSCAELGW